MADTLDFYRQTLPAGGWKEREPGQFIRAGRLLRAVVKPAAKGTQVVLVEEADLPALTVPGR